LARVQAVAESGPVPLPAQVLQHAEGVQEKSPQPPETQPWSNTPLVEQLQQLVPPETQPPEPLQVSLHDLAMPVAQPVPEGFGE
jgi:hypothetical protein